METVVIGGKTYAAIEFVKGARFDKAAKWAKGQGGIFDPQSKAWFIPATSNFLNAPGVYGWQFVAIAEVKARRAAAQAAK